MNFKHSSLILAGLLWLPHVYADTCQGIHITGDIIDSKTAKVVVLDNSLVGDNYRSQIAVGSTFSIPKGNIKKATVKTAASCAVAASSSGEVTALTLTGATLEDVVIEGAKVTIGDGSTLTNVNNIHGLITGVDISSASVVKVPAPEQQDDPLGLKKSVAIATLTRVTALNKEEIPADIKLHYAAGKAGTYTLFTTSHPSGCRIFCSERSPQSKIFGDEEINGKYGDRTFFIPAEELKNKIVVRSWTSGVLVVPYKYTFASHSLAQGSLTVGPYAGYTTDLFGMQLTFPLAAGITKVTIPTLQNGAASTTDKFGLSIATGLLFNPGGNAGDSLKTGILLGVDQLGSNSGYADNGKVWFGIYVGAGFEN